ncbi:hypothetical protein M3Y96_00898700 [Aphelenchoides besseyi]|nr:hypothetical protein M3Y96_00898700 [Aphelenchoides besseyi]
MSTSRTSGLNISSERLCRWIHKPKDLLKGAINYKLKFFGSIAVQSNIHDDGIVKKIIDSLCDENMNSKKPSLKVDKLKNVKLVMMKNAVEIRNEDSKSSTIVTIPLTNIELFDTSSLTNNTTHSFVVFVANVSGRFIAYVCVCQTPLAKHVKYTLEQMYDLWGLIEKREDIRKATANSLNFGSSQLLVNAILHQFNKTRTRTDIRTTLIIQQAQKIMSNLNQHNLWENGALEKHVEDTKSFLSSLLMELSEIQTSLLAFENSMSGESNTNVRSSPSQPSTTTQNVYETPRTSVLSGNKQMIPSLPTSPIPPIPSNIAGTSTLRSTSSLLTSTSQTSLASSRTSKRSLPNITGLSPNSNIKLCAANRELAARLQRQTNEKVEKRTTIITEMEKKSLPNTSVNENEEDAYYSGNPLPKTSPESSNDGTLLRAESEDENPEVSTDSEQPSTSSLQNNAQCQVTISTAVDDENGYSDDTELKIGRVPNDEGEKIYEELKIEESVYIVRG